MIENWRRILSILIQLGTDLPWNMLKQSVFIAQQRYDDGTSVHFD